MALLLQLYIHTSITVQLQHGYGSMMYHNVQPLRINVTWRARRCDANCGSEYTKGLGDALRLGMVNMSTVDRAASRLLREQILQGELDDPALSPFQYGPEVVDSADHRALALDTARQGITLLRNTANLLPLEANDHPVAFLGPHANTSLGMLGNYFGGNKLVFRNTPLLAARRAAVNVQFYEPGVPCFDVRHSGSLDSSYPLCETQDTSDHSHIAVAVAAAKQAQTAVLFLGNAAVNNSGPCSAMTGVEGEGCDRAEIGLPAVQELLLRAVLAVQPRTVVVLMNGGAIAMPEDLAVPALLTCFYPGVIRSISRISWRDRGLAAPLIRRCVRCLRCNYL
eukprot:COSAG01_NODE_3786_length_5696_cov_6.054851_3_plen_338_part_00